jgi:hypothetical protein
MELDEKYILEILVDAAMVAERLTPSDFDERYCKDMEGGYRPEVIEAKRSGTPHVSIWRELWRLKTSSTLEMWSCLKRAAHA